MRWRERWQPAEAIGNLRFNATQVAGYTFDQIIIDGSGKTFTTGGARLSLSKLAGLFLGNTYKIIEARNGAARA